MVASPLVPTSPPVQLILASASPRRRELLAQLTIPFTVLPANIDESVRPGEVPWAYTRRVAYAKAQHVARQFPTAVVLGAEHGRFKQSPAAALAIGGIRLVRQRCGSRGCGEYIIS